MANGSAPETAGGARGAPRPAAIEWLCLAVGVFLLLRSGWILDDAFVYLRYVESWLELGHGLVYNAGEYVEGYTSPAWILLVAGLHGLGLDLWWLTRLLGVASFALFWWWLVVLNRTLAPSAVAGAPVVNAPLVFLSFSYVVACYFTSGVEAPLAQLAGAAYALFLVAPVRRGPGALVALSPLVRPELAVPFALAVAWSAWRTRRRGPPLALLVAGSAVGGAWLLFRVWYYADLLPNTFYLKDLLDAAQGRAYLAQTLETQAFLPLAFVFGALAWVLHRRGARVDGAARIAMLVVALAVAAYVVRIGGDPRHHRYLAFPFVLAVASGAGLAEQAWAHLVRVGSAAWRWRRAWAVALAALVAVLSFTRIPPQLSGHPLLGPVEHTRIDDINDAHFHRVHPDLAVFPWSRAPRFDHREALARWRERAGARDGAPYRGTLAEGWCYTGWERFAYRVVHMAGLTDAILARVDVPPDRPGHKFGLFPLARDLAALYEEYPPARGTLRRAAEDGRAPAWVTANLETLERIERKIHNRHRLGENLRLALAFPQRITP